VKVVIVLAASNCFPRYDDGTTVILTILSNIVVFWEGDKSPCWDRSYCVFDIILLISVLDQSWTKPYTKCEKMMGYNEHRMGRYVSHVDKFGKYFELGRGYQVLWRTTITC